MKQDIRICQNREMLVRDPQRGCAEHGCAPASGHSYALPFAAWELRLYLDTHPDDERALAAFRGLCGDHACDYACAGTVCRGDGWCWIDDPWPWEREANETEGCR